MRLPLCSLYLYVDKSLSEFPLKLAQQIKQLENDLPTAISFLPRSILTSSKTGHIKLWIRPLALKQRHKGGKGLGIGLDGHVDS